MSQAFKAISTFVLETCLANVMLTWSWTTCTYESTIMSDYLVDHRPISANL